MLKLPLKMVALQVIQYMITLLWVPGITADVSRPNMHFVQVFKMIEECVIHFY